MELLDTPNPNAKKILLNEVDEKTIMRSESEITESLHKLNGVASVFFGPGFLTVTNGAGMAADLTLTADADATMTVS